MFRREENVGRYHDLCERFEERFGEPFWMPSGLGLYVEDGIYAIKRALERGVKRNGYEAFDLEPPAQTVG